MGKLWLLLPLMALVGCETLSPSRQQDVVQQPCLVPTNTEQFIGQCDLWYWVGIWVEADDMSWVERKKRIDKLSDSLPDTLEKILLSQPVDTPYQDRLRAQLWLDDIYPRLSVPMQRVLTTLVQRPSNHILETESAIALLSRVNTQRDEEIENLQVQLEQYQAKLEALLNIEAGIENGEQE